MTIYDITGVNAEVKLASVSAFHPDLYLDTTKSSAMSCTGIISRLQANLTLQLRHDIDCLYGVYKCQLDLVTKSGHPEVLTEIVVPEHNHSYSRVAEVISLIDTLTGLFNIHTTLVSNQSTEINKLGSHLGDITSQLMNHTAEIYRLGSHADHQKTILMDQTYEIDKLGSHLDNQTTKLTDQTAVIDRLGSRVDLQTTKLIIQTEEINKQGSRLDYQTTKLTDQTAEINKLGSRLDDITTQLINQTSEINKLGSRLDDLTAKLQNQTALLHNMSQSLLDLETTTQKQQHDDVEKRLMALDLKLDTIQKLSNQTADMFQDQVFQVSIMAELLKVTL